MNFYFLNHLTGMAVFLLLSCSFSFPEAPAERPNIVVIIADDLGYSDLGCYGSEIHTPNIDRLATEGVRFRQFWNIAKCNSTRSSLMSGLHWQDVGMEAKGAMTMGEVMQKLDYITFAAGKWHLEGNPVDRGFDRYFGHLAGASPYFNPNDSWRLDGQPYTKKPGEDFYSTDKITDYALEFIRESVTQDRDKPFFLYLAYNAPHDPLQAYPEDIAKYEDLYATKGWDKIRGERLERQRASGIFPEKWQPAPLPPSVPAWNELSGDVQQLESRRMAVFAAMIDRLDQNIGRVLSFLEESGAAQNTFIIVLSDNGSNPYDRIQKGTVGEPDSRWQLGFAWASVSNTPMWNHKRNMHNGGNMTPCILWWPGHVADPGSINDEAGNVLDIMPTVIELSGSGSSNNVPDFPQFPGVSLTPVLAGRSLPVRDMFFQLYDHRAVYDGTWKLVSDYNAPWSLYNLVADRAETQNLLEENPEKARELESKYEKWWGGLREHDFSPRGPQQKYIMPGK